MKYSALGFGPVNRHALLLLNNQGIAKEVFRSKTAGIPLTSSTVVIEALNRAGLLSPNGSLSADISVLSAREVCRLEEILRPQLELYQQIAKGIVGRLIHSFELAACIHKFQEAGFNLHPLLFMGFLADLWVNDVILRATQRPYLERGEIVLTDYADECAPYEWYGIRRESCGDLTVIFLWDLTPASATEMVRMVASSRSLSDLQRDSRFFVVRDTEAAMLEDLKRERSHLVSPLVTALGRSEIQEVPKSYFICARLFLKQMAVCLASMGIIQSPWCRTAVIPSGTQV